MFGSSSAPPPPPLPDPLPAAPTYAAAPKPAGNVGGLGFGSTLMTSGQGVDSTNTNVAKKSLLGE